MSAQKAPAKRSVAQVLAEELTVGGIANGVATLVTSPLDVIKVRMQLLAKASTAGAKPPGLVGTGIILVKEEGVSSLFKGITPSLIRGFVYGGIRIGLYNPIQDIIKGDSKAPLNMGQKIVAGCTSGALAAAACSPLELAKVRMQAKGNVHKGTWAVCANVVKEDGITGLWRGATPGMARAALITASQCVAYDYIKKSMLSSGHFKEGIWTHFVASMLSGVITTTVSNPVDVVKNIVFVSGAKYKGPFHCAGDVLKNEGPMAFMKGWLPNYARLGPHTVVTFVCAEQLRKMMSMEAIGK